ncbi:hypothetical protein FRC07_007363 [Ceratobasidium sp. 392]|nr:hypothetical protein FRC07_007363 [Ceratobasidium sp. 392]
MKYPVVFATLLAGYVAAQSSTASSALPTSTAGASDCIVRCSQQAATDNCDGESLTDPDCACNNPGFQADALQCLRDNCTPAEQQQALGFQSQLCGASGSGTATASEPSETETDTETGTSTGTATAPLSSSSAASTGSVTSRASGSSVSSVSRTSSIVGHGSSVVASISSTAAAATGSGNGAASLPAFNFAATGAWAAVALGGAAAAQLIL